MEIFDFIRIALIIGHLCLLFLLIIICYDSYSRVGDSNISEIVRRNKSKELYKNIVYLLLIIFHSLPLFVDIYPKILSFIVNGGFLTYFIYKLSDQVIDNYSNSNSSCNEENRMIGFFFILTVFEVGMIINANVNLY